MANTYGEEYAFVFMNDCYKDTETNRSLEDRLFDGTKVVRIAEDEKVDFLDILVRCNVFASKSQARAVGWKASIPLGYHWVVVGKKKISVETLRNKHLSSFHTDAWSYKDQDGKQVSMPLEDWVCGCGYSGEKEVASSECPVPPHTKCWCRGL